MICNPARSFLVCAPENKTGIFDELELHIRRSVGDRVLYFALIFCDARG